MKFCENSKVIRKFTLSKGVLCETIYLEEKCVLRFNVIMASGEFVIFTNSLNLKDFHAELTISLSVIAELLEEEHQGE